MAKNKKDTAAVEEEKAQDAGKTEAEAAAETAESAPQEESTEQAPEAFPDAGELLKLEKEKYLRLMAEYDNFRKRTAKEKESLYTDIRVETITKFLPVYDNLERALAVESADEALKKGIEMTMTQLTDVMQKLGVEAIEAKGQTFDPNLHNAVMHIEDESYGEGEIVEEFQKGFKIADKVIRFSMVKVAN
ncbi:MAG: nucleotide exchange factor GrpE [Oscillospiraceae bacterium]|nr:nucleotide exchange factor GrpE [Oscillospiraceae bacterium]